MRLRVKTLTRRTFGLVSLQRACARLCVARQSLTLTLIQRFLAPQDVNPTASIDELKARLTQETGISLAGQRLVYKGEVLHSGCVQDCGINEDDFLVVVVVRPPELAETPKPSKGQDFAGRGLGGEAASHAHAQDATSFSGADGAAAPPRTEPTSAANVPVQLSELMHALARFSSVPHSGGLQLPAPLNPLGPPPAWRPSPPPPEEVEDEDEDEDEVEVDEEDGEEPDPSDLDPNDEDGEDLDPSDDAESDEGDEVDDDDEDDGLDEEDLEDELQWENAEGLQQLIDMGFPANRAQKALQLNRGNAQASMDWLLEHEGDADIDEPLNADDLRLLSQRAREAREGPQDQQAVQRLIEMGFSEDDIVVALDHCDHDFDAATAWLLGDRAEGLEGELDDEAIMFAGSGGTGGLSMLNRLLHEPHLQQALGNPRVLAALQRILEQPESATEYLDDPELARVLNALGIARGPEGDLDA